MHFSIFDLINQRIVDLFYPGLDFLDVPLKRYSASPSNVRTNYFTTKKEIKKKNKKNEKKNHGLWRVQTDKRIKALTRLTFISKNKFVDILFLKTT